MNAFFEKLTKRNWGAPYHAIITFAYMQGIIAVFKPNNLNHPAIIYGTILLFVIALFYETWQLKKGQTKRGMTEDMVFNCLGWILAAIPLLHFTGNPDSLFALTAIPAFLKKDKLKIVLDPGHGGKFSGAVYNGIKESGLNFRFAHRIGRLFKDVGHEVIFTRETDIHLNSNLTKDLAARAAIANENNADLFISCHCNASKNPKANGFEIYTTKGKTKADPVAEAIFQSVKEAVPELNTRTDKSDGDSDREADYAVLRKTKMPAVLIEFGFMSNPHDLALLSDDFIYLEKISKAVVQGVIG